MLFYSTIQPRTLQLLKDFQSLEILGDFLSAITGRGSKKDFINLSCSVILYKLTHFNKLGSFSHFSRFAFSV